MRITGVAPDTHAVLGLGHLDNASGSVEEAEAFVVETSRPGLMYEFDLARP